MPKMSQLTIVKNKDNTITVKVGNYKEYISLDGKGQMELLDCIRWAAITGGVVPDEATLWIKVRELT
jgi:hypothetical protein